MPPRSFPVSTSYLPPYHPDTKPWYIDVFWDHFLARPFAASGKYGFTGNQTDTSGQVITLGTAQVLGSESLPVLLNGGAGAGAYFTPGQAVVIGDGNYNWQSAVVYSIAGDTLTVVPRMAQAWPAGSYLNHAFGNSTHPAYTWSGLAFGAHIANALRGRCDGQPSLLPPNGAGNGNDLGSMEDQATDTNGVANVPHGWVSYGTPADITVNSTSYTSPPVISASNPLARTGKGITITGNTTAGSGIKTTLSIPVTPGQDYVLSWHGMVLGGSGVGVTVVDFNTPSITVATYGAYGLGDYNLDSLCRRSFLIFTVPAGTTTIQLQLTTLSATGSGGFDDFRLQSSRESALYYSQNPMNGRYVIENLLGRPIVVFGDSYAQEAFNGFSGAIQARLGTSTSVINTNASGALNGTTIATMLASFPSLVLPLKPAYCVAIMGMGGDLLGGSSQATMQSGIATYINLCRQNGIVPVICGVPPLSDTGITQGNSPLGWCAFINDALRAQSALVSQ